MNAPHAEPATVPMRDAHPVQSSHWLDVLLPLATAAVGTAAALLERGPLELALLGALWLLSTLGVVFGWRRRAAADEIRQLVA